MELNREQIIKALECCIDDDMDSCTRCHLESLHDFTLCYKQTQKDALDLIKELTEENEGLTSLVKVLNQNNAELETELSQTYDRLDDAIVDAAREISLRFAMHFGTYTEDTEIKVLDVFKLLDQITEDLLEEIGGDYRGGAR